MIGIGESYIIFNITGPMQESDTKIRLKLFAGPSNEDT